MNDDTIYKGPDGTTALRFFSVPSLNTFHSERTGKQVYDTCLMVEVMVPGMRESTPQIELERLFCEEYGLNPDGTRQVMRSERYAEYEAQIEAYKKQSGAGVVDGFPLSEWPQIDVGTCATLKAAGVFTVEQLAQVNDGNLAHLGMGGSRLRDMAAKYLQTRQFGLPSAQMASENAQLRDTIAFLENQVRELQTALAAAPVSTSATPVPTSAAPAFTPPNIFGIDAPNTLADGVDGLGTLPPPDLSGFAAPAEPLI